MPTVNPQAGESIPADMSVDTEVMAKHRDEYLKKTYSENAVKRERLLRDFRSEVEAAAKEDKQEDTATKEKLATMHSELAGVQAALEIQYKDEQAALQNIKYRDEDKEVKNENIEMQPLQEPTLYQRFQNVIKESNNPMHQGKSIGQALAEASPGFNAEVNLNARELRNALFKTGEGWAPFVQRERGYVPLVETQRPLELLDIIPMSTTNQTQIHYVQEKTFDNKAAYVAEAAQYAESKLVMEEKKVDVVKIGTVLPVTREQLEDEDQAEAYINSRMPMFIRHALNAELLTGAGGSGKLTGVLTHADASDVEMKVSAQKAPSAPFEDLWNAQSKSWTDSWMPPTAYVMAEALWSLLVLEKTTAAGFIFGNPQQAFTAAVWGLPVVRTTDLKIEADKHTCVIANWRDAIDMPVKRGLSVEVGMPGDDFLKDRQTYKSSIRVSLVIRRPQSFIRLKIKK